MGKPANNEFDPKAFLAKVGSLASYLREKSRSVSCTRGLSANLITRWTRYEQKRRNEVASVAGAAQEGNVFRCQAKASVVASGVAAGLAGSPNSARSRPMCGCIRTMIADIQIIWVTAVMPCGQSVIRL